MIAAAWFYGCLIASIVIGLGLRLAAVDPQVQADRAARRERRARRTAELEAENAALDRLIHDMDATHDG